MRVRGSIFSHILSVCHVAAGSRYIMLSHHYIFVICIVGTSFAEMHQQQQPSSENNSSLYRLSKSVLPESYDLLLLTDVTSANFTYEGEVSIRLSIVEKTKRVVLHAYKTLGLLKEKSGLSRISEGDSEVVSISAQRYDRETQFYIVDTAEDLLPGNEYLLRLFFVGQVVDDVFGFYRSSYRGVNGEIRYELFIGVIYMV